MTVQEAAIIEVYTGVCMLTGDDRVYVYRYASDLLGRTANTLDFLFKAAELKSLAYEDFKALCKGVKRE